MNESHEEFGLKLARAYERMADADAGQLGIFRELLTTHLIKAAHDAGEPVDIQTERNVFLLGPDGGLLCLPIGDSILAELRLRC